MTVSRLEIEQEVTNQFTTERFEQVKEDAIGEADSIVDDVITDFVVADELEELADDEHYMVTTNDHDMFDDQVFLSVITDDAVAKYDMNGWPVASCWLLDDFAAVKGIVRNYYRKLHGLPYGFESAREEMVDRVQDSVEDADERTLADLVRHIIHDFVENPPRSSHEDARIGIIWE